MDFTFHDMPNKNQAREVIVEGWPRFICFVLGHDSMSDCVSNKSAIKQECCIEFVVNCQS